MNDIECAEGLDGIQFTLRGEEDFFSVVDLEAFRDADADTIFTFLRGRMNPIPFCDYLKRYIYVKAGMTGGYESIDLSEYRRFILEAFERNGAPKSFDETSSKLSALAKNWLTQASAGRKTVFLLGFGLGMNKNEVSEFLVKALRERDFNFKDPHEVMFWYCLGNGYGYRKMEALKNAYDESVKNFEASLMMGKTVGVRSLVESKRDSDELLTLLAGYGLSGAPSHSVTARLHFDALYQKCREIVAGEKNRDEEEKFDLRLDEYKRRLLGSKKFFDYEKKRMLDEFRKSRTVLTADDIGESDVEKALCCGTPIDDSGNLVKISRSSLAPHFARRRMNRQHLGELLSGGVEADRFDLITLNFFIHANERLDAGKNDRLWRFCEDTNRILDECSMGELYIPNPYECFLQMCMLTDCPLAVYSEVVEKSFAV